MLVFGVSFTREMLLVSLVLLIVSVLSRRFAIRFRIGVSFFEGPYIAVLIAVALGGPIPGLIVAVPAMMRRERLRMVFETSNYTLQVLFASYVLGLFAKPLLLSNDFDRSSFYGILLGSIALCSLDASIGPILLRIKYGTPWGKILKEVVLAPVAADILAISTVLATSYAAIRLGPVAAITLFGGAALSLGLMSFTVKRQRRLAELEEENGQLRERTGELERSLSESHLDFAWRLLESLGRRDGYTARHAAAAAVYATDLAEEFRMDDRTASRLRVAALLQDVGMVSVPEEVSVAPPERLNELGREKLELHPEESERILSGIPGMDAAAKWVRWHHERVDGTGYPDGLRGEWLPLEARILAVASHYASLVLERRNSPALDPSEARREIIALSGRAFDPLVVRTLLRVLDQNGADYASATGERFAGALSDTDGGPIEKHGGLRVIGGGKTPAS